MVMTETKNTERNIFLSVSNINILLKGNLELIYFLKEGTAYLL